MYLVQRCVSPTTTFAKSVAFKMGRCFSVSQNLDALKDDEILAMINKKEISVHKLESLLADPLRAISIRRQYLIQDPETWNSIPSNNWDSTDYFKRVSVLSMCLFYYRVITVNVLLGMFPSL